MRQMFDASQIMTIKDASTILKGLSTVKSVTIPLAEFYNLINSANVIKYGSKLFFNETNVNKGDFQAQDEYAKIFRMPFFSDIGNNISQEYIKFLNDPDTNLVTVTMKRQTGRFVTE